MLAQALFALNSEYYFGDKGSMEAIERFQLQPDQFSKRLQGVLALPMAIQTSCRPPSTRCAPSGRKWSTDGRYARRPVGSRVVQGSLIHN